MAYDAFSQITTDYQGHGGAVNTSTTPKVGYQNANGSAGHSRPTVKGVIQEPYAYTAYGVPLFLTPAFQPRDNLL